METQVISFQNAGFFRRLLAMFYDFLLVCGLVMLIGFLGVAVNFLYYGHEQPQPIKSPFLQLVIIMVIALYFSFFWSRVGQTPGMRAWGLLLHRRGENLSFFTALWRWCGAVLSSLCLGLGYLWCFFDSERRAWHDIITRTNLVVMPSKKCKRP